MLSRSERKIINKIKEQDNQQVSDILVKTSNELHVKALIATELYAVASKLSKNHKIPISRVFELIEEHLKNR
jgi:hypothetical protein